MQFEKGSSGVSPAVFGVPPKTFAQRANAPFGEVCRAHKHVKRKQKNMCGIAALFKNKNRACSPSVLERMTQAVAHRGPDDFGLEIFGPDGIRRNTTQVAQEDWTVGLGHRRLSILDLSVAGHQPMCYRDRYWLTFNGEIYNFLELRKELQGLEHSFRSSSDSEVILAAFAEWGTGCFARFRGMWGLVILDTTKKQAVLSRDRMGIKPQYIWQTDGLVAVASEIKQFLTIPSFKPAGNFEACALYVLTGYENSMGSMFQGVQQVPPGCWQSVDLNSLKVGLPQPYWNPERLCATIDSPDEASRLFAKTFAESVVLHLRSDVPVGCALSGGLDSSAIAVLINQLNGQGVSDLRTFSAVFPGYAKDERQFIDVVLRNISATPSFVTPSAEMFLADLDRFIWAHDEPPGSAPQYSGYCISRLTRQMGVPVTLNGQGGDEVLGGYWQLYFTYLVGLLRQGRLLGLAENVLGCCLPGGNPALISQIPIMWKRFKTRTQSVVPIKLRGVNIDRVLDSSMAHQYVKLDPQTQRVCQIRELFLPRLLKWDDRNFMAFSVEGRYPFLDHELIELCLQFKPRILYERGWTKCPLRNGLKSEMPREILLRRSKFSFDTPQNDWLCGPLRREIEQWLRADRPLWQWMELDTTKKLANQVWTSEGRAVEAGQMLFRLFLFDKWLELFNVSMDVSAT
jgi:asparagine synthase (glutamine-hydrolysing)